MIGSPKNIFVVFYLPQRHDQAGGTWLSGLKRVKSRLISIRPKSWAQLGPSSSPLHHQSPFTLGGGSEEKGGGVRSGEL